MNVNGSAQAPTVTGWFQGSQGAAVPKSTYHQPPVSLAKVGIYPVLVQGIRRPESIVKQSPILIKKPVGYSDRRRGGGSIEAFMGL